MRVCRGNEERLMLYLDNETGSGEERSIEQHLDACSACRAFVERHLAVDRLLCELSEGEERAETGEVFLRDLMESVHKEDGSGIVAVQRAPRALLRRVAVAAASVAAAFLLVWAFHARPGRLGQGGGTGLVSREEPGSIAESGAGDVIEMASGSASISLQERTLARDRLHAVLAGLADTPDEALSGSFREAVAPLEDDGWQVEYMVAAALGREQGPALETAVRLVRLEPGIERLPGVTSSLSSLLNEGSFPVEAIHALAACEGAAAVTAVGRALDTTLLREEALSILESMGGEGAADEVAEKLMGKPDLFEGEEAPFAEKALASLSRMGPEGAESVLKVYRETGCDRSVIDSLSPPDPAFEKNLIHTLSSSRGRDLVTGLRLAASLRIEGVLDLINGSGGKGGINGEAPFLIAAVGGNAGVAALLEMYQGPVSMRQRRTICAALAAVFDMYPDETGRTMELTTNAMDQDTGDVLLEMFEKTGTRGACSALAWLVENQPDMACAAALGLARTGSNEALTALENIIEQGKLDRKASLCAAAAAVHLGDGSILARIFEKEGGTVFSTQEIERVIAGSGYVPGRGSITDTKFEKLMEYISKQANL